MTASKVLVVYYSRTGATRTLAEALAKALQADIEPIIDRKNRSGIFGYRVASKAWRSRRVHED
jgi:flavodoxin